MKNLNNIADEMIKEGTEHTDYGNWAYYYDEAYDGVLLGDLEEDEVDFHDLMECDVYDEDDNFIGKVEEVLETGANAVLRVNKKILIPFVKAFIKESDIENKKIVIHKVEGLL